MPSDHRRPDQTTPHHNDLGTPVAAAEFRAPPGYQILRELGRGGMGVVYLARSVALERECALKVVLSGVYADAAELERFRAESRAVARLRHPGVVQVYEVGEYGGRPFMALEYCPGGSLADHLAKGPAEPRAAAGLVRRLAEAVQAAHDAGIVHRDLKPANVLITAAGEPMVADFGLAKRLDRGGNTQTGVIVGTPSYMPPEQAEGSKEVGPPADLYALGAILYECLTGRPPFQAATAWDTLVQVVTREPVAVRILNPAAPRDLETIAHACLHKSPARRYASASDLAAELGRWLEGRPIAARPVGVAERAAKWVRRNRLVSALLFVAAVSLVGGTAVSVWFAAAARSAAADAFEESIRADDRAAAARTAEGAARKAEADAVAQALAAQTQRDRAEVLTYAGKLALADRVLIDGDAAGAVDVLASCRADLRGWEYFRLWHRADPAPCLRGHTAAITSAAYSPDGTRVAVGGADRTVRVFDLATGDVVHTLRGHEADIAAVVWSPDGSRVAACGLDRRVIAWDAASGKVAFGVNGTAEPRSMVSTPDGRVLVVGDGDGNVVLRDARDGRATATFFTHPAAVVGLAVSPDGSRILAAADRSARVLDARTGRVVARAESDRLAFTCADFSPDGRSFAAAGFDGTTSLYDPATGRVLRAVPYPHAVSCLVFTPDGSHLLCGSADGSTRVLDGATLAVVHRHAGRSGQPACIAVAPDGRRFVAGAADGFAAVRDALPNEPADPTAASSGGFSPDASRFVAAGPGRASTVRDSRTLGHLLTLTGHADTVRAARYSPDGRRIATSADDGTVRLWDAATGAPLATLKAMSANVTDAAFDPASGRVAACTLDGGVQVWDAAGREVFARKCHEGAVFRVAFSPDGSRLLTASAEAVAAALDPADGRKLLAFTGHGGGVLSASFDAGGTRVVTGSADGKAAVFDAATGDRLLTLAGHADAVTSAAFHPDGGRVVTAGPDGTVRVWETRFGLELSVLRDPGRTPSSATFSADGRRLLTLGVGGPRVLDSDATRTRALPVPVPLDVKTAAFDVTGKALYAFDVAMTAACWKVPELTPTLPGIGAGVPSGGPVASPDGRLVAAARGRVVEVHDRRLFSAAPRPVPFDAGERREYHANRADLAAAAGRHFAEAFHVGRLLREKPADAELLRRRAAALAAFAGGAVHRPE